MAVPVPEFDDSEPLKRGSPSEDPSRNAPVKDALQGPSPVFSRTPSGRVTEARESPSRITPRPRREIFEGDAAAIELRSRLAQARDGALPPATGSPAGPALGASHFIGVVLAGAAMAGAAGYLAGGVRGSFKPAQLEASTRDTSASSTPSADLKAPDGNSALPAAQTATMDVAAAGARLMTDGAAAAGAARRVGSAAPPPALQLPPPTADASEIAARLKLGADLMAAGDIAAARTMFMRVAESGDAAGAFSLAETYDPAVLRTMRLRGGIKPDPGLARQWYEKARDMGASAAPERIARLAQNPQ
jgi:hypothetical protein